MEISVATLVRAFLTLLSLVLAAISVLTWRRRRVAPEAESFTFLILSAAIYCFGYAGEVAQTSLDRAMFWLHVEYCGIPWIPALWLLGARRHKGLSGRTGLLFVIPLLTFAGQLTNSMHGLYDSSVGLVQHGPFWIVAVDRGPIAWMNLAYLNFALLYGAWLYLMRPQAPGRTRMQSLVMVGVSLVPLGGYLIYLFGWSPWGLDLAPLLLGISVVLGYIAVFRFGVFDLVPMARSLVFANMRDGVIVTDPQQRLVDFNPSVRTILPMLEKAAPGERLARVLRDEPDAARILSGREGTDRLELQVGREKRFFEVHMFPLFRDGVRLGSAAILADITAQVELLSELQHSAETDSLTGVANRRSFLAALDRECARATRYGQSFSVALVDVDRFKHVNDTLGHAAGDSVLLIVADRIMGCIRASDLLSRYGGDEFALLLPQTGRSGAHDLGERVCHAVAGSLIDGICDEAITVSLSIGLATLEPGQEPDWGLLLQHADKALYEAKAQGRNRVASWEDLQQDSRT